MKAAFIVRVFPAMSESFILRQITGLLEAGVDVEIFAETDPCENTVHDDVVKYNLRSKTHYIASIPKNKIFRRLKAAWLILSKFVRHPAAVIRGLRANLQSRAGFDYVHLHFLFEFLGRRFDILQCHFGRAGNAGVFLKKAGVEGKLVTAFHGYDVTVDVKKAGQGLYKELFETGDVFTYNSEATKEKLLTLGCPLQKMVKLPMGIDVEGIAFSERRVRPGEKINILSVGRLVELKGREYAIRAVAQLAEKFPNLVYNIVGDGPLRAELEGLIKELGAQEYIRILGWIGDDELDRLYKASHIFLHPSVTAGDGNMEGQGVVLLEAQAYGLPVVATKHNAFVETVPDGQSGILVSERDVDAIVSALERFLDEQQGWAGMGRAGRAYIEKNYDSRVLNQKLLDIYRKAAGADE